MANGPLHSGQGFPSICIGKMQDWQKLDPVAVDELRLMEYGKTDGTFDLEVLCPVAPW